MSESKGWGGESAGRPGRPEAGRPEEEPPPVVIRDKRKFDADGNLRAPAAGGSAGSAAAPSGPAPADPLSQSDVDVALQALDLQTQLEERTADLQRITAEYANYRKRVDRDRIIVGEIAAGRILEAMLPILDDIERADAHGDLSGAFKTVADKLVATLTRLGLEPFGVAGEEFDPAVHEAVLHDEDETVEVATASSVMRPGYRFGDRLLRPAMVGVTAPAGPPAEPAAD